MWSRQEDESRLRLAAAKGMVKLYELTVLREEISAERLIILATVMDDPCVHVRKQFAARLHKSMLIGVFSVGPL